jgi:hypothetical protein
VSGIARELGGGHRGDGEVLRAQPADDLVRAVRPVGECGQEQLLVVRARLGLGPRRAGWLRRGGGVRAGFGAPPSSEVVQHRGQGVRMAQGGSGGTTTERVGAGARPGLPRR